MRRGRRWAWLVRRSELAFGPPSHHDLRHTGTQARAQATGSVGRASWTRLHCIYTAVCLASAIGKSPGSATPRHIFSLNTPILQSHDPHRAVHAKYSRSKVRAVGRKRWRERLERVAGSIRARGRSANGRRLCFLTTDVNGVRYRRQCTRARAHAPLQAHTGRRARSVAQTRRSSTGSTQHAACKQPSRRRGEAPALHAYRWIRRLTIVLSPHEEECKLSRLQNGRGKQKINTILQSSLNANTKLSKFRNSRLIKSKKQNILRNVIPVEWGYLYRAQSVNSHPSSVVSKDQERLCRAFCFFSAFFWI